MPTVEGWALDLEAEPRPPVAIGHGTFDQVIGVEWGRRANRTLSDAGFDVFYREYPLPHAIDPGFVAELIPRLEAALPRPVAPQQ